MPGDVPQPVTNGTIFTPTITYIPPWPVHVCKPKCPRCGEPLDAVPYPYTVPVPIWLVPMPPTITYTVTS